LQWLEIIDPLEGVKVEYLLLLLSLEQSIKDSLELLEVEGESEHRVKGVRFSH
jgi:hypothetical protein